MLQMYPSLMWINMDELITKQVQGNHHKPHIMFHNKPTQTTHNVSQQTTANHILKCPVAFYASLECLI